MLSMFKPGDVVKAASENYVYTRKANNVVGIVANLSNRYYDTPYDIEIKVVYDSTDTPGYNMVFPVNSKDFELVSEEEARGYKLVYNIKYPSHPV